MAGTTFAAVVRVVDLPAATTITGSELFEVVQTSAGVGQSVQVSVLNAVGALGLPTGGGTSQILAKSSGSNFSTAWYDVATFITTNATTLATTGSGTGLVIGVANFGVGSAQIATSAVGSTQLGAFAVQSGNVATNAIGNVQLRQGSGLSVVGVAGSATSNVADIVATGANQVLQVNAGNTGLLFTTLTVTVGTNFTGINNTGVFNQSGTTLATGVFGVVGTSNFTGAFNVVGAVQLGGGISGGTTVGTTKIIAWGTGTTTGGSGNINLGWSGDKDYWSIRLTNAADLTFDSYIAGWTTFFTFYRQTGQLGLAYSLSIGTTTDPGAGKLLVNTSIIVAASATGLVVSGGTGVYAATTNVPFGLSVSAYSIGTLASGTYTASPLNGNYQFLLNNGAFTFAAYTTADHALDCLVTMSAAAGAITFTGFTVNTTNIGDSINTTSTNKFIIMSRRINSVSTYIIKALQ